MNSLPIYPQHHNVIGSSRAFKEAAGRKARKIHFYQNGKPYVPKLAISLIPGKDFHSFEQLCEFLTEKSKLLNGVQYIFTTNGRRVNTIDELEHDQSYVISGSKSFVSCPYGLIKRTEPKVPKISNRYRFIREDDLKLIRPLSSKYNNIYSTVDQTNAAYANNADSRIITVVNNRNHSIQSNVILNLKSPKSFTNLLNDLGQSVRLYLPKRMFTSSGLEVKSVSHLKHDLSHINLFYIDSEKSNEQLQLITKFPSLESIERFMEQSVQRLNQISSFSSNIDLRPHEIAFESSLSNADLDKQWECSDGVTTNTVSKLSKPKSITPKPTTKSTKNVSVTKTKKSTDCSKVSAKSTQSKLPIPKQNIRKKSITKLKPDIVANDDEMKQKIEHNNEEPLNLFPIESISDTKYEQIQKYAEQMLKETSDQIRNEGLLQKHSIIITNNCPTIASSNIPIATTKVVNETNDNPSPQYHLSKPEKNVNQKVNFKTPDIIPKTTNTKPTTKKNKIEIGEMSKEIDQSTQITKKLNGNSIQPKMSSSLRSNVKNPPKNNKPIIKRSTKITNPKSTPTPIQDNKVQTKVIPKPIHLEQHGPTYNSNNYLVKGSNVPDYHLELFRIFGELAFYSGVFAILWNVQNNSQRFYMEHDEDIYCMRVDKKGETIASCQMLNSSKNSLIRLWSVRTLSTLTILKDVSITNVIDMEFTINKQLEKDEHIFGGTVHPSENDIMVTYGKMHLVVWHLKSDNSIEHRTALQTHSKITKTICCADFLGDNSLLTGDSDGNLTIWAPFEVNHVLEFAIKEVKGHENQLSCLKLTKNHILISGDTDGTIKTWGVDDGEFRLLNAIKLPSFSGTICSIALPDETLENLDIFVGTSENFILKGTVFTSTNYEILFEGHIMAIRTVSVDPLNDCFYTASLDQKVCKWNQDSLIWKSNLDIQAISSTVHPSGQVLAIGSVSGIVSILKCSDGSIQQHLEISSICIGCMSYSPDGLFLVIGCQDGNLHVLPTEDDGNSYSKVSTLKGPLPILTLQWSMDTQFILTSVDDNNYQELILWDLHNTRYIRNVTNFSDNLRWYNATCSGLDDARGTWDNQTLKDVINICSFYGPSMGYILTGDEMGYVRLFSYPSIQSDSSYYQYKQGGGSVTDIKVGSNEIYFHISSLLDGNGNGGGGFSFDGRYQTMDDIKRWTISNE
ncbi:hypothetical protein RDWZM_006912 [Blomia tropicalis]|uniref:Doublecortin domain-containing protein n=1 Tax=Blomia tropicalis TaxID=40697 RepID=A0A9Q0M8G7_BLOTA|nr:hypothetical protein RDWZM_006912 [Blomia tropicalis]